METKNFAANILKFLYRIKVSIFLFLIIISFYFSLSNGRSFISVSEIFKYSYSLYTPENSFLFIFVHESLNHLFENIFALLAYAVIIELALGGLDVLVIFFFSAIASAIVYLSLNGNATLLGASTGVMGLAATALFLNLKKAIMLSIAMLILVYFIVTPGISLNLSSEKQQLESQKISISEELQIAKIQGDLEKQKVLTSQISGVEAEAMQIEKGEEFAESTPTSNSAHAFGAFFGLAYLFVFRHNKFREAAFNLHGVFMGVLRFVGLVKSPKKP